jgi:formylglycine-generating enzyme required for sulfatase activity
MKIPLITILLVLSVPMGALAREPSAISAVKNDDVALLLFMVKNGGSEQVTKAEANGVTPLHVAAALNKAELVELLIAFGAGPDAKTDNGFTPLHWAASRDAVEALARLLAGGAAIDLATPEGITPLHWAASKNATNSVALLLAQQGDIHSKTASGLRPLHWAVAREADEAANILAYIEVSEELDTEVIETASFEPPTSPDDLIADDPTVHIPSAIMTPTIHKGHSFNIPLGSGEELSFIWLESLKLWFGKFEITNGEYRRFKHTHASMFVESFTLDKDDQPAVFVTWNQAKAYCNWLNNNYSKTIPDNWIFRLATSQEWIFSARCGTERKYPWGDEWPPKYGNFSDISAKKDLPDWSGIVDYDDSFTVTCPVAYSGTNEWGICGMGGNVWEWCEDWYGKDKKSKVRHGGGWDFDTKSSLAIDYRGFDRPNMKYDTVGFRIVIAKRHHRTEPSTE